MGPGRKEGRGGFETWKGFGPTLPPLSGTRTLRPDKDPPRRLRSTSTVAQEGSSVSSSSRALVPASPPASARRPSARPTGVGARGVTTAGSRPERQRPERGDSHAAPRARRGRAPSPWVSSTPPPSPPLPLLLLRARTRVGEGRRRREKEGGNAGAHAVMAEEGSARRRRSGEPRPLTPDARRGIPTPLPHTKHGKASE